MVKLKFEDIMDKNFPNLMKILNLRVLNFQDIYQKCSQLDSQVSWMWSLREIELIELS